MSADYKEVITNKTKEAKTLMQEDQLIKCNLAIHTASVAAAAAGMVPIPVVDAIPITGAQITMTMALGSIFNQKLEESAAKALIGAAASTFVGRTLVKFIPLAGWIASGAIAAGVTEAIGWTLAVDFAKDYNLQNHNEATSNEESMSTKKEEIVSDEKDSQAVIDQDNLNNNEIDDSADEFEKVEIDSCVSTFVMEPNTEESTIRPDEDINKNISRSKVKIKDFDDVSITNEFDELFGEDEFDE